MIERLIKPLEKVLLIVATAAALFFGVRMWEAGWFKKLIAEPASHVAQPITCELKGPEVILVGGEFYFIIEASGGASRPQVSLVPETPNAITLSDDGRTVRFQSEVPGTYSLQVAVGGPGGQVASDHLEFENLEFSETPDEPAPDATGPPMPNHGPGQMPPQPSPFVPLDPLAGAPTVTQLVEQALADVDSEHKAEEQKIVAGVIRSMINRIQTGLVEPSADVFRELEDQIEITLGERARSWGLFVVELRAIADQLRAQGALTTAATFVPMLRDTAAVLSRGN